MGVTIVIAVYGQPLMLEKWWETLRSYPEDVRREIAFILVDDHGDPEVSVPDDILALVDVRVLRITKNIPWNQMGARNLGMQQAETDWRLMLDPDMVAEATQMRLLLDQSKKMRAGSLVKPLLRFAEDDRLDDSSPNVYLIHRDDFERVQGYDEDYSGHKGWSDCLLLHTLKGTGIKFLPNKGLWVRYYQRRQIADATVYTLDRSVSHNRSIHLRKMAIAKRNWNQWNKRKSSRIRFPWTRVI